MTRLFSCFVGGILLSASIMTSVSAQFDRADVALAAAVETQTVKGDLRKAIVQYKAIVDQHRSNRAVAAQALLRMAECYRLLGDPEADAALQQLLAEYGEQPSAAEARRRLKTTRPAPDRTAYVERELWSGPGLQKHMAPSAAVGFRARPSADGRWLAFVDWASQGNVALRNVTTGEMRLVTSEARGPSAIGKWDAEGAFHPRVSPDGSLVAYQWGSGQYAYSIRVASISGGRPRVLLQRDLYAYDIAWAPDGGTLAAIVANAQGGSDPHIALISTSDGSITRLKSLPYRQGYHGREAELGGFSPDGRYLVYSVPNELAGGDGGIFAIARDGSHEGALVRGRSTDRSPVWTPDGGAVVFVSDRSTNNGLWSVGVANGRPLGAPILLRGNVGPMQALGFSRDGSLFYGRMGSQDDVFVSNVDARTGSASSPVLLVDGGIGANRGATWSPDGRYLAFVRSSGSEDTVIVRRGDGTEQKLTTRFNDGGYGFAMPSWLPDSRSLLVPEIDRQTRRSTFRKVHVETLEESILLQGANWEMRRVTGPSPDGRYLFYSKGEMTTSGHPQTVRLVRRELSTGQELELHRSEFGGSPAFYSPAISPDGTRLAFTALNGKESVLMTVPTAGDAPPREIARGAFLPGAGDPDQSVLWSRDSQFVLVAAAEPSDRRRRVWAVAVEGGAPSKLDLALPDLRLTDISPDGRQLVLAARTSRPEVGVLQNLMPRMGKGQ